ncbi:hypothetical protein HYV82_04870 [Candidatus Woesearchaeota archaeon]|nr:hypothetical protein [Candidatus Woesearchaeota archaeon]
MRLSDGEKVIFVLDGDTLLMKKASSVSWDEITRPLRKAAKRIKESDLPSLIQRMRREKRPVS